MIDIHKEYCVSKFPKLLPGIDSLRPFVQNWFAVLNIECRCYAIGMALLVVAVIVALFKRPEAGVLAQVGAFVFAVGLLPLIERLYEWAWRRLLGKLLIAALIALATNMAYGFGRQLVATLIGTSPEPFAATVSIATVLLSPVLFLMALAIGGFFIFLLACFVGILALMAVLPPMAPGRGRGACVWVCRFVALAIAVFGSWAVLHHSSGYAAWASRRTAGYLYTFDMYQDTQYTTGKTEKVALLGDGRILVGTPNQGGSYTLEIRSKDHAPK